ncbi:MAG: tryptophan 7-halogenase [Deltaproteobacteria bacterium]|nr:tryptophan 7-halogenase [Deltaproteobacteria bacterium]
MSEELDVVVVGGGPAGSTAAAIAARRGLSVLLLEGGTHPRPHVGESLLPGIIPILEAMGALEAVEAAGFRRKSGSTHHGWGKTPAWDLWFRDSEAYDHAWLVERARFDAILFESAQRAGARCLTRARATSVIFEGERAVGVRYTHQDAEHEVRARFVIDASGQPGLVARARDLREPLEGLRHLAGWAHWEAAACLPAPREDQAFFIASATHWTWMFPFGGGRCSIGVVTLDGRTDDYDALIEANTELREVIGPDARRASPVRWERDWSYRHREVAGPGWLACGDAAGFIDPVLSTGVLLAMHAGWSAARAIADVREGSAEEGAALEAYTRAHRTLFGDLLRIVRFFYGQNLTNDDYFWQAKSILLANDDTSLKPQRAFLVLTSGLVGNLAFDQRREQTRDARVERTERGRSLDEATETSIPETLGFVCLALSCDVRALGLEGAPATLHLLIEPTDSAAPTLFRTEHFDVNCLAPRFGNDPIRVPELAPVLESVHALVRSLDTHDDASLSRFWARARGPLAELVATFPPFLTLVRVFGE